MSAEEAHLVHLAAGGDPSAYSTLVQSRWAALVRFARSVVGEADAEDAVQDGLVHAWRQLGTLRDRNAFTPWLTRVVLRICLRRAGRRKQLLELVDLPEEGATPVHEERIDVERKLGHLAPRQRAVLHFTAVEGMSDREIAGLMNITPASVRSHRRRARQRLHHLLNGAKPR